MPYFYSTRNLGWTLFGSVQRLQKTDTEGRGSVQENLRAKGCRWEVEFSFEDPLHLIQLLLEVLTNGDGRSWDCHETQMEVGIFSVCATFTNCSNSVCSALGLATRPGMG